MSCPIKMEYHQLPQPDEIETRVKETDNELMKHFEIISTHPNFRSRIREALSYVPEENFEANPIDLDWEEIRAEL
jgi:hypothetical protein